MNEQEVIIIGDVICGNCGEPWEAFYIQNEMKSSDRARFQTGTWCPSCKGEPVEGRGDNFMKYLHSATENTDEDPLEVIDRALVPREKL